MVSIFRLGGKVERIEIVSYRAFFRGRVKLIFDALIRQKQTDWKPQMKKYRKLTKQFIHRLHQIASGKANAIAHSIIEYGIHNIAHRNSRLHQHYQM